MNTKHMIVLITASILVGATSTQLSFGESIQITEGLILSGEQVAFIIGIGAFAGLVTAFLGYDKTPNDFDPLLFTKGVIQVILVSVPAAFGVALGMPSINAMGYVIIFFAVVGGRELANKAKQKSIPSNASEEEIQKILDERG